MLTLTEALNLLKSEKKIMPAEEVSLTRCYGRILAVDVFSDIDMPPFNKSAVDGYACRKKDLQDELKIIGTVYAGEKSDLKIEPFTCIKIMTGSSVPAGADTVIMIEDTELTGDNKLRFTKSNSKTNICYKGEDVYNGDQVLKKGILLLPHHIGVLASVGMTQVKVSGLPKIALIPTGSELTEPDKKPEGATIRNSNTYNLIAQLYRMGLQTGYSGIVKDDPDLLSNTIGKAIEKNDVVIITGGASVGEHDYIPEILSKENMTLHFDKLAIQPGKPVSFSSRNGKYCFGLSGNPVSSFLQFELLVKPFIYHLMGHDYNYPLVTVTLTSQLSRKKSDRMKFVPVKVDSEMKAIEVRFNGSAHIAGLTDATGFGLFPLGTSEINKGETLKVLPIN